MGRHSFPGPDDQPDEESFEEVVSSEESFSIPSSEHPPIESQPQTSSWDPSQYVLERYEDGIATFTSRLPKITEEEGELTRSLSALNSPSSSQEYYSNPEYSVDQISHLSSDDISKLQAYASDSAQTHDDDDHESFVPELPVNTSSKPSLSTSQLLMTLGVIIGLVAVVVGWRVWAHHSHHTLHAARQCSASNIDVGVVVDSSIVDQIAEFAQQFNSSANPIGQHCIAIQVTTADADTVIGGFTNNWPSDLGLEPAIWIPASTLSTLRLQEVAGKKIIADQQSLVTSPVIVAIRPELAPALQKQTWATLPELQTNPDGLPEQGLFGWGSLRLALPTSANSDAAFLAGEAVTSGVARDGKTPLDGLPALRQLVDKQPKLAEPTLSEAMNALLGPEELSSSPVHGVVTTEQQLFSWGKLLQNAKSLLTYWLPAGPVPVADYPVTSLSGEWLSPDQIDGANQFANFIREQDQLAELAKAGFRADKQPYPASEVTDFPSIPTILALEDPAVRTQIATVFGAPSSRPAITIMLDTSMPLNEEGKDRLTRVTEAINNQLRTLPPASVIGLWTFDGIEGRSVISTGPLDESINDQLRLDALTSELDGLAATRQGAVSFTTLRMVYNQVSDHYREGQSNSILVITSGPHTDHTLDGQGLRDFLRTTYDTNHPITVNVIDLGDDPDESTWQDVAKLTNGRYEHLDSANTPELASQLSMLLS